MSTALRQPTFSNDLPKPDATNMRFGIVVSKWNPQVTDALLKGAVETLKENGVRTENIIVKGVPGSFELIYGANKMIREGHFDGIIILGSVIRGETPHFDYICQGVTNGAAQLNATGEVPVIYGLLTTENLQQALERAGGSLGNKGSECAEVAICMAAF